MLLRQIQGNARACVIAEPLFVVPFSLYSTYASVYMLRLHVTDTELGLITSINLVLQVVSAFVSGYLTDRLGRRKALWMSDIVSWSLPMLIWALSQNFWWFLVAAVVNSVQRISTTAWYCLLVEDTEPSKRTHVFMGLQVVGVIGGMFAPLGGLLISHLSLVPAVRIMYLFAGVSISFMIFIRHKFMHDTEVGIRRMQAHTKFDFRSDLRNYSTILKQIFKNRTLLLLFAVYVLWNIQMTIRGTFVSVYQVDYLKLPTALISIFPAISSVAMILLLSFALPRFREEQAKTLMKIGFLFLVGANLILLVMPLRVFSLAVVSTILAAVGTIVANPYVESVVANAIDDEHRATMLSVLNVLILIFTSPAGIIGGWTYSIDPRIPIALVILAFLLSIVLVVMASRHSDEPSHLSGSHAQLNSD